MEFYPVVELTWPRVIRCQFLNIDSPRAKYLAEQTLFRWMLNQWKPLPERAE